MNTKRNKWLIVSVALFICPLGCRQSGWMNGQPNPNTNSILSFVSENFIAGCVVDLDALESDSNYQNFPIDSFVPSAVSFERFFDLPISQLGVFIAVDEDSGELAVTCETAAVAKLDLNLTLNEFLALWHKSKSPYGDVDQPKPELVRYGEHTVYRLPPGTFLNPRRRTGKLAFTDREGQPDDDGIRVGDLSPRGYVAGATESAAIFSFENLNADDLIEESLAVELRLDAFRIGFDGSEFGQARVYLRRPDQSLVSEAILFPAMSFVNHRFDFPRKLIAKDRNGVERTVDVVKDMVVGGKLEIVVQSDHQDFYLGFLEEDMNIVGDEYEYARVVEQHLIVSQSLETISGMLAQTGEESSLAKGLQSAGGQTALVAKVVDNVELAAWNDALNLFQVELISRYLPDEPFEISVTFDMSDSVPLKINASSSNSLKQSSDLLTEDIGKALLPVNDRWGLYDERDSAFKHRLIRSYYSDLTMRQLAGGKLFFRFPELEEQKQIVTHLKDSIDNIFRNVDFTLENNSTRLKLEWKSPALVSNSTALDQAVLANFEQHRARILYDYYKQPVLAQKIQQRRVEREPKYAANWFSFAHQLSFNTSMNFDDFDRKYYWIRRGIEVLLEGAEQNPDSIELRWMAAHFVAFKIGRSDERAQWRTRFSRDTELHGKLEQLTDSEFWEQGGQIDSWLVAKSMFEQLIAGMESSSRSSTIPAAMIFSRPAVCQIGFAQALDEAGQFDEAVHQWEIAEQEIAAFGQRVLPISESDELSLAEWPQRADEFREPGLRDSNSDAESDDSFGAGVLEFGKEPTVYDRLNKSYRVYHRSLWQSRIERLEMGREIRRLEFDANSALKAAQSDLAMERFEQALEAISQLAQSVPDWDRNEGSDSMHEAVAVIYSDLIGRYKNLSAELDHAIPESLKSLTENQRPQTIMDYWSW